MGLFLLQIKEDKKKKPPIEPLDCRGSHWGFGRQVTFPKETNYLLENWYLRRAPG